MTTASNGAAPPLSAIARPAGASEDAFDESLRATLQTRLRQYSLVVALAVVVNQIVFRSANREWLQDPRLLLSENPNVLESAFVALWFGAMWRWLHASRRPALRFLRLAEVPAFGIPSLMLHFGGLRFWANVGDMVTTPVFAAQAAAARSVWGVIGVFAYVTLIPNGWRRALLASAALIAVSFLPDVMAVMRGDLALEFAARVFSYKAVALGIAAALASLGAWRTEVLSREVDAARRLGQYVLRERLGAGGMGEVWRADHARLRRPCAIKLIDPAQAGDAATLARFEREVQATAGLSHPNTVQVFDYGRADDGTLYCVMEYLPGETLEARVARDGAFATDEAVRILRQLCGSLGEAHAAGLVHRDIKPGNVMLCERGGDRDVVKLLDFGLVRAVTPGREADAQLTQQGIVLGTPSYMSPEQCAGDDTAVGPASDIYSLGALATFLLTGQPPFAGRSPMQLLAAHLYETPPPPSTRSPAVPEGLDAIVLRCLTKDPAARYPSVGALNDALQSHERPARRAEFSREVLQP